MLFRRHFRGTIFSARGIVAAAIVFAIVTPIVSAQDTSTPDTQQDGRELRDDGADR